MITLTTNLNIGDEVRRDFTISARYQGLPKGSKPVQAFDLGTVVALNGDRVQVLWHTYRADRVGASNQKSKRTWIKMSAISKV